MLPAPALVLLEGLTSAVSSLSGCLPSKLCFGAGYSFGALFGGRSSCFTVALVCSGADHIQWACACVSPVFTWVEVNEKVSFCGIHVE